VTLENDAEDQLGRSCEKWRRFTAETLGGRKYRTYNKRKEGRLTGSVTCGGGTDLQNM
jgi:hypothetical protein